MKKFITRRSFLITNLKAGLGSFAGKIIIPGIQEHFIPVNNDIRQKRKSKIWTVRKELYVPSPEPGAGISLNMSYIGSGLKREETRSLIRSSDWVEKSRRRTSLDNGRTWSDWELIDENSKIQGDCVMEGGESNGGTGPYDPVSHRLIKPVFQRIVQGNPEVAMSDIWKGNRLFCDHAFYQLSDDNGLTWGEAFQLKYEEGPDFNPKNWIDEKYYRTNEMYIGNSVVLKNGSVVISATVPVPFMDEDDSNIPLIFPNNYREGCVGGALCFVGRWNEFHQNYDWKISKSIFVPRRISTRGLVELHISELTSNKLLLVMRGSNAGLDPVQCPGRKWFSVSEDGGLTWSDVKDIRYDTGEQFYSPASISSTFRSSENGKLYWVGNISEYPVKGNSPRYPLQIVEVDENNICFKKETLTTIDDRDPSHDSESLQLSNFSILENRETNEIELYLLRLGERGEGDDIWTADVYKYTLSLQNLK